MADAEMLTKVKAALGISGAYMDYTISIYIDEVTDYMARAGVPADRIAASAGVVARGVNDVWTNAAGAARYSPYFYDRVTQLAISGRRS